MEKNWWTSLRAMLRAWLVSLGDRDCPPDPLTRLGPRDLADLPVWHPKREDTRGC